MSNTVFLFIGLILTTFVNVSSVSADGTYGQSGCVPVYGGGVQCPRVGQVLIDKTVRNPSTNIFVDNLGPSDPKFKPRNTITFRLTMKNTGDKTLDKITVVDHFPSFVDFTSGPGKYDSKTKNLTFDVLNLAGGTAQRFDVTGRIVSAVLFPTNKSVFCDINTVDATSDSQKDSDSSQFCLVKEMVVPEVPTAGPQHWILSFVGLSIVLTTGIYLRKKALFS